MLARCALVHLISHIVFSKGLEKTFIRTKSGAVVQCGKSFFCFCFWLPIVYSVGIVGRIIWRDPFTM